MYQPYNKHIAQILMHHFWLNCRLLMNCPTPVSPSNYSFNPLDVLKMVLFFQDISTFDLNTES